MLRRLDLLCAALSVMILLGCVPIPIPVLESSPTDKAAKTITVGQTTRADVLSSIGEPPFVRRKGSLFIYRADRVHAWIVVATPLGGGGGVLTIKDVEFFAINFDNEGIVRGVERAVSSRFDPACLPSGICLSQAEMGGDALLAPSSADAQAKLFAPDPEFCTLYLFREDGARDLTPNVTIDGEKAGTLPVDGFMRVRLAPGKHEVLIELFNSFSQKLDCNANQVLFWRAKPVVSSGVRPIPHRYDWRFYLEPVPPDIGHGGVQKGKLLFGPLD